MTIQQNQGEFAIEVVNLTKRFRRTTAVDALSLQIPYGSTFGLIGPNGAGKSTTIKMLMAMLSITSGEARIFGTDVFANPSRMKERVGYVPENHQIYRWMRVREVIRFAKSFYSTWDDDLAAEMLDLFSLDVNKKVKHLSRGMVVKLSLLLAVSHQPELLILDEPMSGLDPLMREEFLDGVLQTICQRQRTVLFSSHTLDDIQRLADTVGILYEGRLLVHRNVDELLGSTKRIRAVLSDGSLPQHKPPGMIWERVQRREWLVTVSDFSPEIVQRLSADNCVEHVEVIDLGLEEVFKDYVKGRRMTA